MKIKLYYLGSFESEFQNKKYKVSRFLDLNSLTIIYGSNLDVNLKDNTIVDCIINIKRNKLVVEKVL